MGNHGKCHLLHRILNKNRFIPRKYNHPAWYALSQSNSCTNFQYLWAGYEDYTGETPLVSILRNDGSLNVEFKFRKISRRCLPYLTDLEVIFYQPYAIHAKKKTNRWMPSCLKASDSSFTCSQTVNFGYINGCRSHNISYRPWFSLKGNNTEVWNNEVIGPLANSSTSLGDPAMLVNSENFNHLNVMWKTPTCLFGNIVKWNLSIRAHQQHACSIEIPFNCTMTGEMATSYEVGHQNSIQILNNTVKCPRGRPMVLKRALQLASCTGYQVTMSPVLEFSHGEFLVSEFRTTQNLSTWIDSYGNSFALNHSIFFVTALVSKDVQDLKVVDIEPESFNIELAVPSKCSGFNVEHLRVNGEANARYVLYV